MGCVGLWVLWREAGSWLFSKIERKQAKGGLCPRKSRDQVYSSERVLLCSTENRLETSLEAPLPHCSGRGEGHLDEGGREGLWRYREVEKFRMCFEEKLLSQ